MIPLTIESKNMKLLEIKLTKDVKDQYTKIYKTLMREVKEDLSKCRIHCAY